MLLSVALHAFFIKVRIYFSAYLVLNVPTSSEGWVIRIMIIIILSWSERGTDRGGQIIIATKRFAVVKNAE